MLVRPTAKFWFDNISASLHLPQSFGIYVVGLIPATALWALGIDIRIATDFTGAPLVSLPLLITNVLFILLASRLIRNRTLQLEDYTRSLGVEPGSVGTWRLASIKGVAAIWLILLCATSLVIDPYIFGLHYSVFQSVLRLLVTSYLRFIQATFLWSLGCAMYLIYAWGKLPIRLKSFTEDQTLGLNSYGRASLFFVTLYIAVMLLTFPILVYRSDAVMWSTVIFSLLGLAMFLVPLFTLRRRLLDARADKLTWIRRRHSRVIESIESCGDGPLEISLVNELIAVDSIRNDLHKISGWPFNAGVVARLVTVVFVPLSLYVISTYLAHTLNI